ncbi:MAG TPA: isochorismatase family cysteine hydrolase [Candidatus Limnocylindria bacterium]|nr:isochorismatase family cysteine hydrolase [Candidatus Limnocylindria bacterium]
MQSVLIVVDMQNDFISGALGTPEAREMLPRAVEKVRSFQGPVLFTRDTHPEHYLKTREGRALPVVHCVRDTRGWEIHPDLEALRVTEPMDKPGFGALALGDALQALDRQERVASVTLIGLCTDVCVISDAIIARAALPEAEVTVDADCVAGLTPQGHRTALLAMQACHINISGGQQAARAREGNL